MVARMNKMNCDTTYWTVRNHYIKKESAATGFGLSLLVFLAVIFQTSPAFAQYTKLFDFGSKLTGANPLGTPVSDGTYLYGTSYAGGPDNVGIIYKVKLDGTGFTQLHAFDGATGALPVAELLFDGTFLYGTTRSGGTSSQGTIFRIKPDGTAFSVIFSFQYFATGGFPSSGLITDGTVLYGMTSQGGTNSFGTVFKINKDGTGHTKLVEFNSTTGSDPQGSLLYDGTFLYGTTQQGGANDVGSIFKVKPDGTGFQSLFSFSGAATGINPIGSLITDGTFLYGLALRSGSSNGGTMFKIQTDGNGFVKIVDFSNGGTAGAGPKGSLVSDGTFLYGLTTQGGTNFAGAFFRIKPDGSNFTKLLDMKGDTNGPMPEGTLLRIGTQFYGVRSAAGGGRYGTIFRVNNDGSAFTTIFTFEIEANNPGGRPIFLSGSYYGLATVGGLNDDGAIYKINPDGTGYTRVFNFDRTVSGARPNGSLISDGTFLYGMTSEGGANNEGTIFKVKPDGTGYQNLMDFSLAVTGGYPSGSFISDGTWLYGMTPTGGASGNGVIFKIQLNGTNFTNLKDLDYATSGSGPYGTLIFDGTFLYGLASSGGVNGQGTAFKIKTDGSAFTLMHEFDYPQGATPRGSLTAVGSTLYGFTASGGDTGDGTIFKINTDGSGFGVLMSLDADKGRFPYGSMILVGSYLYGLTSSGGELNMGTVFRIKPDGTGYQKYMDFNDGSSPIGSLVSDGTFLYGTTSGGGQNGLGTFFKVSVNPFVSLTSFEPEHAARGTYITLRGHNFDPLLTGNVVAFDGSTAEIISGTSDSLVVVVPETAVDGFVTVTAGGTTSTSADVFIIDPEAQMIPGKIKTCGVTFVPPSTYDQITETIIPATPGAKIRISFSDFNVDDIINIYDGPDTSSTLLAETADINPGDEFVATNASGVLTIEYIWQDASVDFTAEITCDGIVNSITIDTQPVVATVCSGATASFTTAASGTTNIKYQWQFSLAKSGPYTNISNGSGYSNATTATLNVNTAGNFGAGFYRCMITGDLAPGKTTNEVRLSIIPTLTAPGTALAEPVCGPASVELSVSGASNGDYKWYTTASGGTAIALQNNSTYKTPELTTTTTYYASIATSGCESARTPVIATINACDVVVYNAVSPNGDGKNDVFFIESIEVPSRVNNQVKIFNRWGDEVFSINNYNNTDKVFVGMNKNGNKLPGGIYYYTIALKDENQTLSGYLELRY